MAYNLEEEQKMLLDEHLIPVIYEGVRWVKERMGPSKKVLKLRISDLEDRIRDLSSGKQATQQSIEQIMRIILEMLSAERSYIINADTIIQVKENNGQVNIEQKNIQLTEDGAFDKTNVYTNCSESDIVRRAEKIGITLEITDHSPVALERILIDLEERETKLKKYKERGFDD